MILPCPRDEGLALWDQGACIPSCEAQGLRHSKTNDYIWGQEAKLGHLWEGPGQEVLLQTEPQPWENHRELRLPSCLGTETK